MAKPMPHHPADKEPWEDDRDDDEPTVPCPHCKREVHEDCQRCPYCENYISEEDAPSAAKPWWLIVGVGLCLYAVYRWITAGG